MELHRHISRLVRYNGWANDHILAKAVTILPELPVFGETYGVLPDELLHILQSEQHWLSVWRGELVRETVNPSQSQLIAAYATTQGELEAFVESLDESDLARVVTRVGRAHQVSAPLGDFISHLVSHGTYHRGEIALLLTQAGASPGDIDFYDFLLAGAP